MDVGGAADLQTDIMRFMAILSLCLVAIFALVQSIPLTPAEPVVAENTPIETLQPETAKADPAAAGPVRPEPVQSEPVKAKSVQTEPVKKALTLTRPEWVPKYEPVTPVVEATPPPALESRPQPEPQAEPEPQTEAEPQAEGFTLRFESDAALARAVAASHVGLYAIENDRAQRMTVSESRISFWAASTPNIFHEMEAATVPAAVIDALQRTGTPTDSVSWGVTLPGRLKAKLDSLMQSHRGGSLIIGAGGDIRWEAS
jgi:hypothetical protein